MTVDTLALLVTPANDQDCDQVQQLTQKVQEITGEKAAEEQVIRLEVIKLQDMKKGFVLLPRWVVRRSYLLGSVFSPAGAGLRMPAETLIGLLFLAFVILMAKRVIETMLIVHNTLYCYNYLVPNLEFQESSHAFCPFRRRRCHHCHGGRILA
jgi:hypothetical protein